MGDVLRRIETKAVQDLQNRCDFDTLKHGKAVSELLNLRYELESH